MATRGPNSEIVPDFRGPAHWIAIEHAGGRALGHKALREVEACASAGDLTVINEYLPLLADAYRRLHKLGPYAEKAQPAAPPSEQG